MSVSTSSWQKGDYMYSTYVSTKMTIDKEGTTLDEFDIGVCGYKDKKALNDARINYKRETDSSHKTYFQDWRAPIWYILFGDMKKRLRRWRYRTL